MIIRSLLLLVLYTISGLAFTGCAEQGDHSVESAENSKALREYQVDKNEPAYVMIQVRRTDNARVAVDDPTLFNTATGVKYFLRANQEEKQIANFRADIPDGPQAFIVIREYGDFEKARHDALKMAEALTPPRNAELSAIFAIPRSLYVNLTAEKDFGPYIEFYKSRLVSQ